MDEIVSLAKRRGIAFQSSEIYGGLRSSWDYGPIGVELKNNIKQAWWRSMVQHRDDIVGLDAAVIMSPKVWEASGHLEFFHDPLGECLTCHQRYREDQLPDPPVCPNCGAGLAINMAGSCSACNAKVTSGDFDWVLSRIEQDEAYTG